MGRANRVLIRAGDCFGGFSSENIHRTTQGGISPWVPASPSYRGTWGSRYVHTGQTKLEPVHHWHLTQLTASAGLVFPPVHRGIKKETKRDRMRFLKKK